VNGRTHLSNDHFWRARARWQVCRTFSKWAGLAGLRVGYALGDPALIERMLAIKQVRPASERESASS
jgi:histidinol-phosphate/aromatic aminotransferase/cobyric acid decarboxylase-like protein